MSGIFISYRREDSADEAHRLNRELSDRFGDDNVFIDVEDIALGENFAELIDENVGFCDALVAVIGTKWLACTDATGRRRIDDPQDWVRLEITAALSRDMKVFPVLVGGAALPEARALPPSLAPMVQHQALILSADKFAEDAGRLAQALDIVRKGTNTAALWFSIIARRHRALDPLDLRKPEVFWRALRFLLLMLLLDALLRLPVTSVPGSALTQAAYVLAYMAADFVEWLGAGFILHFAMRAFGGTARLQVSIAAFCYLAAYLPLIAIAQVPVWGVNIAVVSDAASVTWDPTQAVQKMRAFIEEQGTFGIARIAIAFLAATYLWWRLLRSVFDALRTLHRLSKPLALAGVAVGFAVLLVFVSLVIVPYFGTVYERFVR
jgi:TIR domain